MTLEEFINWMEGGIDYKWEEDCQFPYKCRSDCYCQRMREKEERTMKDKEYNFGGVRKRVGIRIGNVFY